MRFIIKRVYRYGLKPSESLSPITLLKMDVELQLLGNFPSTTASNFWDCLTKSGGVDFCISPTSWIKLRPQGGSVPIIPIRTGEEISTMPMELPILPGVLPLTPVILTCRGFLDVHAPLNVASAKISFVSSVRSVYGINLIAAIYWSVPGFVGGGNTGMVR